MRISFNVPPYVGNECKYINDAINKKKICGDGEYTMLCSRWLEKDTGAYRALLTTSCTHATEMAAILLNIKEGDEVIMPAYTFVSTANAFVLRGAKVKFVDIRPDTMNIDENLIEAAITERTKCIVPVHYAGVSCEMDKINDIARKHEIHVVEDAAQGMMSTYKGKRLGTFGDFGCYSFHETKNYSMGEGGCILINNSKYIEQAEVIREKGTNRSKFWRGEIDKYTWIASGSSYLPSELNAAHLWAQLEASQEIYNDRMRSWNEYYTLLTPLKKEEKIQLPVIPKECIHNGHMFYIKVKNIEERTNLIDFLKAKDIYTVFHYIPLHSSPAGRKYGEFIGEDRYTTNESERLLRLPMYYGLTSDKIEIVVRSIEEFYKLYKR